MVRRGLGFSLVDLTVTLALVLTLASMASLYYKEAQDERVVGIITNDLDTYSKALQAWETVHRRNLDYNADLYPAMKKRGIDPTRFFCNGHQYGTLDFLVDEGRFSDLDEDPYHQPYLVDPVSGIVFSSGPDADPCKAGDNKTKTFRTVSPQAPTSLTSAPNFCVAPPVIANVAPQAMVNISNPTVRAAYFPGPGCAIDLKSIRLYLRGPSCSSYNGQQVTQGLVAAAGQLTFIPGAPLCDGQYTAVLVVRDTASPPHETRQEWTFLVDTVAPIAILNSPGSGRAVNKSFPIVGAATANALRSWVLNWDFRVLKTDVNPIGGVDALGQINSATIEPSFDTQDPLNPVSDGWHFCTLAATDQLGQTVTAQNQVLVDNTPPVVHLTKGHPKAYGTPQQITTTVPILGGISQDNLFVRDVRFTYIDRNSGLPAPGQPLGGTTAVPVTWDPRTALDNNTVGNWGANYNSSIVEFSTIPSLGTTSDWAKGGFRPLNLQQGQYTASFVAHDLPGNQSTAATTDFDINLHLGGLASAQFLNTAALAAGPPFSEDAHHITALFPVPTQAVPGAKAPQTSGAVRFVILEAGKTDASTWEVVIDDNGSGRAGVSADGAFVTTGTTGSGLDWVSTGSFKGLSTGVPIITPGYDPNGKDPRGHSNVARRTSVTNPQGTLFQGVYKVRIRYTNDEGVQKTAITSFYVDNTPPVMTDAAIHRLLCPPFPSTLDITLAPTFPNGIQTPNVIQALCGGTGSSSGFVEMRGAITAGATTSVISYVGWHVAKFTDFPTALPAPGCGAFLTGEVPGLSQGVTLVRAEPNADQPNPAYSHVPGAPTLHTVNYSFDPTMLTTSTVGGLDGRGYLVRVVSVDGAGLSTCLSRWFTIATVGPIISQFTLSNQKGGSASILNLPNGDAPTVHTIAGQSLSCILKAVDEVNLSSVRLNVFLTTGTPGLGTTLPFTGSLSSETKALTIARSDDGLPLLPLPATYRILIRATNLNGQDGPTFETRIGLQFLTNLAIIAPYYVAASDPQQSEIQAAAAKNAVWMGSNEQTDVANFIFNQVGSAATKRIFDFAGRLKQSTVSGDNIGLGDWIAQSTSNKTTDVLIVLDNIPTDIYDGQANSPLEGFLESKSADPSKAGNTHDGDTVVWVGEVPFFWVVDTNGNRRPATGLTPDQSGKQTGQATVLNLGSATAAPVYVLATSSDADSAQVPAPIGNASAYLADLVPYNPFTDFQALSGDPIDALLKNTAVAPGPITGSAWTFERLYSVDSGKLSNYFILKPDGTIAPGTGNIAGNNILLRNTQSGGVLATLMGMGPSAAADPTRNPIVAGNRKPVSLTGPVVVDFIDKFLLNQVSAADASHRVLFNNATQGALAHAGTTGRDVVAWPAVDGSFTNVTKINSSGQDSPLVGQSANEVGVLLSRDETQINANFHSNASGVYLSFGQGSTVGSTGTAASMLFQQPAASQPVNQVAISAGGNAIALSTLANFKADSTGQAVLEKLTIFYESVGGSNRRQITTGVGTVAQDAYSPAVAPDGDFVAFVSKNIYNTLSFPDSFNGLQTSPQPRIYRYTATANPTDPGVYLDAEVSRDRLGTNAVCDHPAISRTGKFVVFEVTGGVLPGNATANAATQIAVAFNARPGQADPWTVGAVTSDTSGSSKRPSVSSDALGGYPLITFQSKVNYTNRLVAPDASGNPQDVSPSNLNQVPGATSVGGSSTTTFVSIYLFAGTTTKPLLRIAAGDDADCLNPQISADGTEIVFESRATRITGFAYNDLSVSSPTISAQTIVNSTSGNNRVYRIKLRNGVPPANGFEAAIERVSPADLDLGTLASPQISN